VGDHNIHTSFDKSIKEIKLITESKASTPPAFKTISEILLVTLGILAGAFMGLIALWCWFDYQTRGGDSTLASLSAQLVTLFPPSLRETIDSQAQVMGLPLTGQTSAYWYMARAGGIIAYLLLWLSVIWGLTLSTKISQSLFPAPIAYGLHEFLSLMTLAFVAVHTFVLLGDPYVDFNIFHLIFPFTAPYEPVWTGLGVIAFYLAVIMTGSFYIRKLIGQKLWRVLHYLTFVTYLLALGHGFMAGTDSSLLVVKFIYGATGLMTLFLVYYRLLTLKAR
jgi:Ferric reductase like transmembrane component